ncbi:MAG: hypothetical protein C4534_07700 [Gaiellales bacterium]|nr:MAG: hypothetical protein C4534_07700 [Gaiellales bacterium]
MKLRLTTFTILTAVVFLTSAAPALALEARNIAVSKVSDTAAVLVVKTDVASDVTVEYGSSPGVYGTVKASNGLTRHEILIDGLSAGMTVYYTVGIADSADPGTTISISEKSFRTARAPGDPFSFTVSGDNRPNSGSAPQPVPWWSIMSLMAGDGADLSLSVGDIIYGMTDSAAQNAIRYDGFFAVTSQLTGSAPMYVAAGNHERLSSAAGRDAFEEEFTLPENDGADAATDGELYYSFDHGDTHFVALSTEIPGEEGMVTGDQQAWLEADLAANTRPWVVVFMHRPLFRGMHAGDPWVDISNAAGQQNRADIHALFLLNDVDLVFAGHEHLYFHHVEDGIHYVITGGGGAPLSPTPPLAEGDVFAASDYHYVKADESLALVAVDVVGDDGAVLESFTLGEPDLGLTLDTTYWSSYSDYLARNLTAGFTLANTGEGTAVDARMVYLSATNSVSPVTPMPLVVGDIAEGGTVDLTLEFGIPQGVVTFRAISYATCQDLDGNLYQLPGPSPS